MKAASLFVLLVLAVFATEALAKSCSQETFCQRYVCERNKARKNKLKQVLANNPATAPDWDTAFDACNAEQEVSFEPTCDIPGIGPKEIGYKYLQSNQYGRPCKVPGSVGCACTDPSMTALKATTCTQPDGTETDCTPILYQSNALEDVKLAKLDQAEQIYKSGETEVCEFTTCPPQCGVANTLTPEECYDQIVSKFINQDVEMQQVYAQMYEDAYIAGLESGGFSPEQATAWSKASKCQRYNSIGCPGTFSPSKRRMA